MKNFFTPFIFAVLFLFSSAAFGQNYSKAIGARLGYPLSISGKIAISENSMIEGIVGFKSESLVDYFNVGIAYQRYNAIDIEGLGDGLSWYYGLGANVYFWSFDFNTDASSTSFGIAGYLGLDYSFENVPINLSLDWSPVFFINGYGDGFDEGYGALAIRYIIN